MTTPQPPEQHTARATHSGRGYKHAVWANLVYLAIPAFQPSFDPTAGWADWTRYGVMLAVFVPLFALEMLRPRNTRWWFVIPTVVLGAVFTPFNSGMAVLFVFAAAFAGIAERPRVAVGWFAGLSVLTGVFGLVSVVPTPWRWMGLVPSVLFIWVVGVIQLGIAASERETAELRVRSARIEHLATMAERERIARDLHDLLGHSLTAMVVRAQLVQGLVATEPERAGKEAAEIETTARDALGEVRHAVRGWRLASLQQELDTARGTLAGMGIELTTQCDAALTLVGSAEHELALATRELLTNVARHSAARNCHVQLGVTGDDVRLVIADDGSGDSAGEGSGLRGVRERISALGGWLDRQSHRGTTVTVSLPAAVAS